MNIDDALEAAKIAAMVGGQLKTIDKYSVERTNNPANKININNFIAQVKNPRASIPPAPYLANVPAGYAPPPPEEFVQSQVPDIIPSVPLTMLSVTPPPLPTTVSQTELKTIPVATPPQPTPFPEPVVMGYPNNQTNTTNLEIASTLKSIDKTLADMLTYMKEKLSNE
jgi:hypothetical protein